MTEKVCNNIYRLPITLPNSPLRELNSYVIVDENRSLLIDTGFNLPACREAMDSALRELGLSNDQLDIFLTHGHSDHIGMAGVLAGKDTKVYLSRKDAWFHRRPGGGYNREEKYKNLIRFGFSPEMSEEITFSRSYLGDVALPPRDNLVLLEDGDTVKAGGYAFRCILTPGHTQGHLCLWEEREKILFSGDHVLFDITPNIDAWETPCSELDQYIESLYKVDALDPRIVLPGHRKTGDFHQRIQELIRHHDDRLLECLRIILDHPNLTAYEIARRLSWKFREKVWDKAPPIQQWFATGECIAHIGFLMEKDNVAMWTSEDGIYHYYSATEP
jgi:glyoxylase-like metal-dependent hydrolase (beta-lactamase superfamily II)